MKSLVLNQRYSREEVHQIFSPETEFTPQAGTWGLRGIVKVPNRDNDFVFFVTYGQKQGDHSFDEGLSPEGVLRWQSQPSQDLDNEQIQKFINHNEETDNIYLFLREKKGDLYKYYGRLKYLAHDESREKPVYFQWQLLELNNEHEVVENEIASLTLSNQKPAAKSKKGLDTETFRTTINVDYAQRDAKNRDLGLLGEKLVLEYEKRSLIDAGKPKLADRIVHVSVVEGDGAGYDIRSFDIDGNEIHIEVKTTRGGINTDFFMSARELVYAQKYPAMFRLYRLYDVDSKNREPKFYILNGPINEAFEAEPTNFRMKVKNI